MKLALSFFIAAVLVSLGASADLCVSVSSFGSADGSDWDNALGASFTPVRGNTYYIADGDYGSGKTWSTAVSGTTAITIKKATVAEHGPSTGWSDTMGDGYSEWDGWVVTTSYWNFDGVTGGGPGSWATGHGFKLYNTADGANLVLISGETSNITISRVMAQSDRIGRTRGFVTGVDLVTDITFDRCAIYEVFPQCVYTGPTTRLTVERCYLYHNRSTVEYHGEGHAFYGAQNDQVWRWNLFQQIEGTAVFAGINVGTQTNLQIYGNIFEGDTANPLIYYFGGSNETSIYGLYVLNNTFASNTSGTYVIYDGSDWFAYNNIWYANDGSSFAHPGTHDYTFASDNIRSSNGDEDKDPQCISGEANGQNSTGSPFVSYTPGAPTASNFAAETNAGFDTGGIVAGNDLDMFGNTRGSDDAWDRGAVEYDSGNPPSPTIDAPATVTATATSPHSIDIVWDNVTGELGFIVKDNDTVVAVTEADVLSLTLDKLDAATEHVIKVSAFDAVGSSDETQDTATTNTVAARSGGRGAVIRR